MPWYSPAELAKGMSAAADAAGKAATAAGTSVTKMVEDMDAAAKAMEEERKIKEATAPCLTSESLLPSLPHQRFCRDVLQAAARGVILVRNLETGELAPLDDMSPVKGRYQAKTSHDVSPRHSKKSSAKAEEEAEAFAAATAKAPALLGTMDRIYTEINDGKPLNSEQVAVFFIEYQREVEKVTRPKKKVTEGVEKAFRLRGLKPTVSYASSTKVVPGDVVTFEASPAGGIPRSPA